MNENLTWCKEVIVGETHTLDYPPTNKQKEDGSWIINYNLNPAEMTKDGYSQWTDEQLEAWHEQYDPQPIISQRTTCTKYQLVSCLTKYYPELKQQLIQSYKDSSELQFYWNTVVELDKNNDDFKNFVNQLGITDQQISEIFNKIEN